MVPPALSKPKKLFTFCHPADILSKAAIKGPAMASTMPEKMPANQSTAPEKIAVIDSHADWMLATMLFQIDTIMSRTAPYLLANQSTAALKTDAVASHADCAAVATIPQTLIATSFILSQFLTMI